MNDNFELIKDYIAKHDKFVISTHQSPDADGLGSCLALRELLENIGKKAIIINSDPTPDTLIFFDINKEINVINDGFKIPDNIEEYAQFVLDTNDYDNIGIAYEMLKDRVKDLFIIDHHEGGETKFNSNFIKASASSTSEIIYGVIQFFNKPLSFKAAQAIYTGIVFDTGSFKYPKTSGETYRIAGHCVDVSVKPPLVHEYLYENNSIESFKLRREILSTMEIHHDGKLISMKLTHEMIKETGASFSEGEPTINLPLTVKGVVASLLVKHDGKGPVKVSMRTKGNYNVAEIAIENNGGGHKNAAGYQSKLPFEETYNTALKNMERLFVK